MILLTNLFKASDIYEYTIPIVFELAFDSVSEVRHKSYAVVGIVVCLVGDNSFITLFCKLSWYSYSYSWYIKYYYLFLS